MLAHRGIGYAKGSLGTSSSGRDARPGASIASSGASQPPIRFVDNDEATSAVHGDAAILLYLDAASGHNLSQPDMARKYTRFQQALFMLDQWRSLERSSDGKVESKVLQRELTVWDAYASEGNFLAGPDASIVDFAAWPVLHQIVHENGSEALRGLGHLEVYYCRLKGTNAATKATTSQDETNGVGQVISAE